MSAWPTVRLGEVIRHRKGSITIDDATTYKLCRVQLHRRGVVLREHRAGSEIRTKKQQVCQAGDFLVAEMDAKVGGYGFVPADLDGAIVSSHYFLFELDETRLWPGYLEVVSQAEILQRQIVAKGSTNYAAIRPASVLGWEIPLPPLAVQKRLAANFTRTRTALATAEREITHQEDLVAKLKQAILQEAITGRLTEGWRSAHPSEEPARQLLARIQAEKKRLIAAKKLRPEKPLPPITEDEIPFALPEGWEWCRLGSIGLVIGGLTKNAAKRDGHTQFLPYLRVANVYADRLDLSDLQEIGVAESEVPKLLLEKDDLLVVEGNGSRDQVGRIARWDASVPQCVHQNHVIKVRLGSPQVAPWAIYWFLAPAGRTLIEEQAKTSTGLYNLSTRKVANLPIPLPPLAEQTEIVERVQGLMDRCRELEAEIERSRAHAAALLQAVLREAFAPATSASSAAAPALPTGTAAQPAPTPLAAVVTPPRKKLNQHFARAVLSAEIVHQLHAEPTFGRVKHQKIFHLCEHIARIEEIAGQYHREAAGPLDNRLIYANEGELKKQQWYREVPRDNAHGHAYVPLPNAGSHEKYLASFAEEQASVIRRLIKLMRKWDTDRCEIFCTAYAAWNDLILWKREPSEDAILHEILERWNPAKRRFPRQRWQAALKWMREHDFIPTGFGNPTAKA